MSSLRGKVVAITGASRGIGRACAESFAAEGSKLVLCASQSRPDLPAGAEGFTAICDVSDSAQVDRFFLEAAEKIGPIDVLVLNAGVLERAPIEAFTEAQWDRVFDTNLKGAFFCARALWPSMVQRKTGRIIALGSISGTLGTAHAAAYNASKWGLTGLIKSLAEEGRAHGILCASVLPGSVDTEMLKQTPYPPQMKAEEIARVVKFVAGEAPFATTGSAIELFG